MRSEFSIAQATYFENLQPAAIVGVDYVAYRFNCSESAVIRGRFETNRIPKIRKSPIAFIRRDVDEIWRNLNSPVSEKAAKIRHKTKHMENKNETNKRQ
jgi:hypothetical protein